MIDDAAKAAAERPWPAAAVVEPVPAVAFWRPDLARSRSPYSLGGS